MRSEKRKLILQLYIFENLTDALFGEDIAKCPLLFSGVTIVLSGYSCAYESLIELTSQEVTQVDTANEISDSKFAYFH
jgi:hypothetical protein